MRRLVVLFAVGLSSLAIAAEGGKAEKGKTPAVTFQAVDIYIDSGKDALAAYQVEVKYDRKHVTVVGVEGGEPEAFQEAPHYDRKGMSGGRIVIAAFTLDDNKAPEGKSRVARLHLQVEGKDAPQVTIRLVTAAKPGGEQITTVTSIQQAKPPKTKAQPQEK